MTQLLISVKNIEEAIIVLDANVDIIDLKDPSFGALGALDLSITKQIVRQVNGYSLVSATVGEHHTSVSAILEDIKNRADMGVDIIKIAVGDLFQTTDFYNEIAKLAKVGTKIIAVFFADEMIDLNLLPLLKSAGFYGAMLDTKNKHKNLLQAQDQKVLHLFTQHCQKYQLTSGLAGSLQPQHIDMLVEINPTYIGFRGGVCQDSQRQSTLIGTKVMEVKNMLRNGNRNQIKAQLILGLALHS